MNVSGFRLFGNQIDRCRFAAPVDFQLKFEFVALFQPAHPGSFDCRNMHKCIWLTIIPLDESEAFHAVEELDRSAGFFSGQFPLRGGTAIDDFDQFALNLNIGSGNLATSVHKRKAQSLAFGQPLEPSPFNLADMHKDIVTTRILDDESEAFLSIEKLNFSRAFANHLIWHATAAMTATTAAKAAVGAGVSFYWGSTVTLISVKIFIAEAVALIPASTTPVPVKTHS